MKTIGMAGLGVKMGGGMNKSGSIVLGMMMVDGMNDRAMALALHAV